MAATAPITSGTIQGLQYERNVNIVGEPVIPHNIIELLDNQEWKKLTPSSPNSRLVQHYGYTYDYKNSVIAKPTDEIPEFLIPLKEYLTKKCIDSGLINPESGFEFNQCIVNNYYPGQGISPHIDLTAFGLVIGCFTIGSGANMLFEKGNEKYIQRVELNSLYIMSGESRYKWKHSMPSRKYDEYEGIKIPRNRRISITFRNVPLSK
jgi:alkylated DNA repair dioxygenase AlkB